MTLIHEMTVWTVGISGPTLLMMYGCYSNISLFKSVMYVFLLVVVDVKLIYRHYIEVLSFNRPNSSCNSCKEPKPH